MNAQSSSLLFCIPFELRDEIYSHLFTSTRLTFGSRVANDNKTIITLHPPPHALALLRACRRINAEIDKSWLSQVLFKFEDPKTMLDKLAGLSFEDLSLIRYVTVRGDSMLLTYLPKRHVHHRLVSVLKLLPGLQLHQLTVFGGHGDKFQYRTLDELVRYGSGWRELRFISHSSGMLGYAYYCFDEALRQRYQRRPQPEYWQSVVDERDGVQSCPSVVVYRATRPGHRGDVLRAQTREQIQQSDTIVSHTGASYASDEYGTAEDPVLVGEGERSKEVMVVVRRGRHGVDYQEKDGRPLLSNFDIRREFPGRTWAEIRAACIEAWDGEDRPTFVRQVDLYHDIDEYIWTACSTYNPTTRDLL
ncbi:hypothetical protein B0T21DRAFT_408810 [Apiosordaria backusii]|uniref:F-box domain-containing protein n=1 Tax=Apiosordaria backusii TaxID=314023 RepID=A0AA40EMB4_9PEZI|nr:hypothetical protein B0T21DRAFT_408810 [Apiosordaria backusii]